VTKASVIVIIYLWREKIIGKRLEMEKNSIELCNNYYYIIIIYIYKIKIIGITIQKC